MKGNFSFREQGAKTPSLIVRASTWCVSHDNCGAALLIICNSCFS